MHTNERCMYNTLFWITSQLAINTVCYRLTNYNLFFKGFFFVKSLFCEHFIFKVLMSTDVLIYLYQLSLYGLLFSAGRQFFLAKVIC